MKKVLNISLGSSYRDYEFTISLFGETIQVTRFGTNGDVRHARELARQMDGQVDAIALPLPTSYPVGMAVYRHKPAQQIAKEIVRTPVHDGTLLASLLEQKNIVALAREDESLFSGKRVLMLSGIVHEGLSRALMGFADSVQFGDPVFQLKINRPLSTFDQLANYARYAMPLLNRADYDWLYPVGLYDERLPRGADLFASAEVIAGSSAYLRRFAPDDLRGKTIVTDWLLPGEIRDLKDAGVTRLVTFTQPLSEEQPFVGTDVLEAILAAASGKSPADLHPMDYVALAGEVGWTAHVEQLNEAMVELTAVPNEDRPIVPEVSRRRHARLWVTRRLLEPKVAAGLIVTTGLIGYKLYQNRRSDWI